MQFPPAAQLKINQFLRPVPSPPTRDSDCFIIEPGDATSNKISNGPTDSIVHAATPKKHPKINDSDDDDKPLAPPLAVEVQNLTMQQGDGRGVVMPHHHGSRAVAPSQPASETKRRDRRISSSTKAKTKHKRQATTSTTASV
jgi:hypothetical protein